MIRVDATGTRRLSLITAQNGAVTAVGGSSFLTTTGAYTDLVPVYTTISSATTTSIDAAPAANTVSDYDFVSVKNTFAGSHTMTLQIISGSGGPFPLKTFTLLTDESMNYAHGTGFQFFDASGNLKESLAAATNWGVTGNLTVGGNTTLGDAAADSLTINAGVFSFPGLPAFLARKTASTLNVTGNNTVYTYICDGEIYDVGSNYNSTTGTFTAPVTGKYDFTSCCYVTGITLATSIQGQVVTSNRSYRLVTRSFAATTGDQGTNMAVDGADMDAGDTATVTVVVGGIGADTADVYGDTSSELFTWFSGAQRA